MGDGQNLVSLITVVAAVAVVVLGPSRDRAFLAMAAALAIATSLPLNSVSPAVSYAAAFGVAICAVVSILSVRRPAGVPRFALLAGALFLYIVGFGLATGTGGEALMMVPAALIAVSSTRLSRTDLLRLARFSGVLMSVHVFYAIGEVAIGLPAVWPMANGQNEIAARPSEILPWLVGRPMTSFSHPILFAYFLLLCLVLFLYAMRHGQSRWYGVAATVSVGGIALTGTRSALLTAAIVIVAAALLWFRVSNVAWYLGLFVATASFVLVYGIENLLSDIGLGGSFSSSPSYLHRSAVLGSFPMLFSRGLPTAIFGAGTDIQAIFASGMVRQYAPGYDFFDNQFVFMTAVYGVAGLVLLVALLVLLFWRGETVVRLFVLVFVVMSYSFDTLTHFVPTLSLALMTGLAAALKVDMVVEPGQADGRELEARHRTT